MRKSIDLSHERELAVISELRAHLDQLERQLAGQAQPICRTIQPGDLAQIRPDADELYGGLVIRVTRVRAARVDGYILRPHRCGTKLGWIHYTAPQLERIGRLIHREPEWGFRGF